MKDSIERACGVYSVQHVIELSSGFIIDSDGEVRP